MQVFIFVLLLIQSPDNLGHIPSVSPEAALLGDPLWEEYYCCSQPFVYENLANGLGFSSPNSWMVADDFTYPFDGYIDLVQIWAIYASSNATGFNIQLRADSGSGPGSIVSSHTSTDCTHSNTGYTSWGYPLYYTLITTPNIDFTGGTKYWFAMQTTGGSGAHYWLCANQTWADMTYFSQNNGSTWSSSQAEWGEPYEQFLILTGYLPLERDSWGGIKVLF
ncbi:MAG: hypothetical protein R6V62_06800 [Candidatus Fermentibacteraceae bacterium]